MTIKYSLEIFPVADITEKYLQTIAKFVELDPEFISVTCGAGGNSSSNTTSLITNHLINKLSYKNTTAHITCLGKTNKELLEILKNYDRQGINKVVALRGDMPASKKEGIGDFSYASELVEIIKSNYPHWDISVAGYPEGHPEAISMDSDLKNLQRKVDAGSNKIITQFFFDTEVFLSYKDKVKKQGIEAKVIPGILPIINFEKMLSFAKKCNAQVPPFLIELFKNSKNKEATSFSFLIYQIESLIREGVEDFHFYTLNNEPMMLELANWIKNISNK
jgi:methylenetetrahydrofolate reductase (NADPH)